MPLHILVQTKTKKFRCKPAGEPTQLLTCIYHRFISRTKSAFCSWLLTSIQTLWTLFMQGYPIKLHQGSRKRAINWLASARVLKFCVLGWSFARKAFSTMKDLKRRTELVRISCPLVDRRILSLQALLIPTMSLNKWLLQASGAPPCTKQATLRIDIPNDIWPGLENKNQSCGEMVSPFHAISRIQKFAFLHLHKAHWWHKIGKIAETTD